MGKFIDNPRFIRHFPAKEDSCLLNLGYNDFHVVKPAYAFRMQTFYTWHFVLSGKGTLEIGDQTYDIDSEQMFFIPPGVKMRYYPKSDALWEYVWFALTGNAARQYGELLGFSLDNPVIQSSYFPKIRHSLKSMFESLDDTGGYFSALSCFYEIMEICTSYAPRTGIRRIKKLIDESFAFPAFNIQQLCYDAGISHAHMLRLFKDAYGTTVKKYVIQKRIALACELLVSSDLSVKSVAYSCGFSDELHFMKTFKKETGLSALQYKKQQKPITADS